jgi:uncharacterized membrane protein YdbT with pleckstrin-like domain
MGIIEDMFLTDETVLERAKLSRWYIGLFMLNGLAWVLLGFLFAPSWVGTACLFNGLFMVAAGHLDYVSTDFLLTNRRLITRLGIIQQRVVEIKLDRIESIEIKQGFFGRLLGYGDLVILGSGRATIVIPRISNPTQFRNACTAVIDSKKTN